MKLISKLQIKVKIDRQHSRKTDDTFLGLVYRPESYLYAGLKVCRNCPERSSGTFFVAGTQFRPEQSYYGWNAVPPAFRQLRGSVVDVLRLLKEKRRSKHS